MSQGASAPSGEPLAQGGEGLLLGPLHRQAHLTVRHRHGADLQPLRSAARRNEKPSRTVSRSAVARAAAAV